MKKAKRGAAPKGSTMSPTKNEGPGRQVEYSAEQLARLIDHTLLKTEAGLAAIERLCQEAREHNFLAVCVNSVFVPDCVRWLKGTHTRVCTVVGFPLGAQPGTIKAAEAEWALARGATEIDMVLHVGALKSGEDAQVLEDIRGVVGVCRARKAHCKVILETCLLTQDEKTRACRLCIEAGAHFVKTSTGFSTGGATVEDVALLASLVAPSGLGVKASGGIRSYEDAVRMVKAGATRLGASSGVTILAEARARAGG